VAIMAIASPALTSFNAGEWSSLMQARSDVDKYRFSCRTLENFLPTVQGPARKRPGTAFVGKAFDSLGGVRLIPWVFNRDTAYVLELTNQRIRIWRANETIVESAPDTPLSIVAPWTGVQLRSVQFTQVNNVMYLVHPDHSPHKLVRNSDTSWSLSDEFGILATPYDAQNEDATSYLLVSSLSGGAVTCTSSTNVFTADMVGSYVWFFSNIPVSYTLWKPSTVYTAGAYVYSERADIPGSYVVYECIVGGTSGTIAIDNPKPGIVFTDGTAQWSFRHIGASWAKITAYTSATQVTISVGSNFTWSNFGQEQSRIPRAFLTGGPTGEAWRWSLSAWSSSKGYPGSVVFYENRIVYGGVAARPTTIWGSRQDSYNIFHRIVSLDDEPFEFTLTDGQSSRIAWMAASDVLSIGSGSSEYSVTGGTGEAITPTNVRAVAETRHGADPQMPVVVGGSVFFVQRNGGTVREWVYDDSVQGRRALDRTVVHDGIARNGVRELQYASEPDSIIWGITSDKKLVALTYEPDEQVFAWSRHDVGGDVESIASIPSPDGDSDCLWISVRRDAITPHVRNIERMTAFSENVWLDSSVRILEDPASASLTGVTHLVGETVSIVTDGAVHPDKPVVSGFGDVTLDYPASDTLVGYTIVSTLEPQRLEAGSQNGTSQGKRKKISNIVLHLYETGGGLWYGTDSGHMYEVQFRSVGDPMDTAVPPYTGWTVKLPILNGHLSEGKLRLEHRLPQPCTVMAIYPQIDTEDDR
jgi:hypothetical protein